MGESSPFRVALKTSAADVAVASIVKYNEDLRALYEAGHAPPPCCR